MSTLYIMRDSVQEAERYYIYKNGSTISNVASFPAWRCKRWITRIGAYLCNWLNIGRCVIINDTSCPPKSESGGRFYGLQVLFISKESFSVLNSVQLNGITKTNHAFFGLTLSCQKSQVHSP
jgi:hypothetical protein